MFQFTPVLRRATRRRSPLCRQGFVSIHARLATGDTSRSISAPRPTRFNSRPSCDGRPVALDVVVDALLVSIHARLATGDSSAQSSASARSCFNSRPSCDGRLLAFSQVYTGKPVSIHARLATGDKRRASAILVDGSFNSRPSCDGRLSRAVSLPDSNGFQFTPVLRRATHRRNHVLRAQ